MRSPSGQAAPEYVAALMLVAVLLGVTGALARPDLTAGLVRQARTALCIVGGDVCRNSDAVAAGLEPCVVRADDRTSRTGMTLMFLRSGEESAVMLERLSDGSFALSKVEGKDLGAGSPVDVSLGAAGRLEGAGGAALKWRSGKVWRFPDEAALRRVFARMGPNARIAPVALYGMLDGIAPAATYVKGGGEISAGLSGSLLGARLAAGEGSVGQTLGRRISPHATTWFVDASGFAPRMLGGVARGVRAWTLEVDVRAGEPRRLVLRGVRAGERREEITARLDLADPSNRAAAGDLLGLRPPWTPLELARLATIGRHVLAAGTVERQVFRETEVRERDWSLGIAVAGFDHVRSARRRVLVQATLHGPDGRTAHRMDCLQERVQ